MTQTESKGVNLPKLEYFVTVSNQHLVYKNNLSVFIYQGHHGDLQITPAADFIFPSTTFLESNNLFLNVFGMVQSANKVLNLAEFRDVRSDWKIIKGFSIFSGIFLRWFSLSTLREYLVNEFPLQNQPYISFFVTFAIKKLWVNNYSSSHFCFSPYKGDPISTNSKVMALCNVFSKRNLNIYSFSH